VYQRQQHSNVIAAQKSVNSCTNKKSEKKQKKKREEGAKERKKERTVWCFLVGFAVCEHSSQPQKREFFSNKTSKEKYRQKFFSSSLLSGAE
jgi:hypothetical protein